jgi:beta-glucanase (GH16 family)
LEWYDPGAITTKNGSLVITLSKTPNHNLNYMSGMMSTWNKFCFTGGYTVASVQLPGSNDVVGLWPAIWYVFADRLCVNAQSHWPHSGLWGILAELVMVQV